MKNIWVPLSGQIAQQRKVETISNNVANINTPGFKKDQLVFKERLTALTKGVEDIDLPNKDWAPEDFYHSHGAENAQVVVDGSYTVFQQGQLSPTSNPLDVGLRGPGFIEVLTPNGIRFTRKGSFNISKDGDLVTDQGYRVLSGTDTLGLQEESRGTAPPEQRVINVTNSGPLTIDLRGNISSKGQVLGKLSIVEFKDPNALKKEGSLLFINANSGNIATAEAGTTVHQGFLEQSNVNAMHEMSELIKAHRHFESIQKAINAYDSISNKAVNDIARF